ncbi:hypothetical protein BV898_14167 [Hypsibius exemplaris]|uniref:NOTCH1 EGF-like calcium-binding domain-containing protein n=1 Tax=Hypsibius exemplaris TaxID=2072580 RepID=A0A1W0W8I0_HYPEX|nr:hypothetical protein BV898_14167 [Hypsibius exemplaris]
MSLLVVMATTLFTVLLLQNLDQAEAARLSLKSTDINSLYSTALAVARSNPRMEGLRFFVGYACDPDHPFNCLFSTCQADGLCGCNSNETTFLQMLCLPQRRLGQSCIDNQQCRKMTRNSKCDVPRSLTVGTCKCTDGTFGKSATCNRALSINATETKDRDAVDPAKLKSCSSNQQCLRFGKSSECNLFIQQCQCKPGFRMDEQDRLCRDINECKELPPMETCRSSVEKEVECVNTEGSFQCYCRSNKGRQNGRAPDGICCTDTQIACDKESKCVDITAVCDGFPDCKNGYDETFDFCVKPRLGGNETNIVPSRNLVMSPGPIDPLPFTQF